MPEEKQAKKPFDLVSIILLVSIAAFSDASDLITAFLFGIPIIGQILYTSNALIISPGVWGIIQIWFFMAVGFGSTGIINIAGGIANVIGIPGVQTVTVAVAIYIANNPKLKAVAKIASGKAPGSAEKEVLQGAQSAEKTGSPVSQTAEKREERSAKTASESKAGQQEKTPQTESSGGENKGVGETPQSDEKGGGKQAIPEEMFGVEKEPIEKLKEYMEEFPETKNVTDKETEEDKTENDTPSTKPQPKVEDIKRQEAL